MRNGPDVSFAEMLWRMNPQSIESDKPTFEWLAAPEPVCDKALPLRDAKPIRFKRKAA